MLFMLCKERAWRFFNIINSLILVTPLFVYYIGCTGDKNLTPDEINEIKTLINSARTKIESEVVSEKDFYDAGFPDSIKVRSILNAEQWDDSEIEEDMMKSNFDLFVRQLEITIWAQTQLETLGVFSRIYLIIHGNKLNDKTTVKEMADKLPEKWIFLEKRRNNFFDIKFDDYKYKDGSLSKDSFKSEDYRTVNGAVKLINRIREIGLNELKWLEDTLTVS